MRPTILIVEPRQEIADGLEHVIAMANYTPLVRPHIECLTDLGVPVAAIVIRIAFEGISAPAHAAIARLQPDRPPVVAIAGNEVEAAEATRLGCEVILRTPGGLSRLPTVLSDLVHA